MSQIYDGPGKARKQCASCKKYVHARSSICPGCNTEFKAGAKAKLEERQTKTIDRSSGGKGRKQCPACKAFVGARTQVCECGNDFSVCAAVVKEKAKSPEHIEAQELMLAIGYSSLSILYTPAGEYQVKLKLRGDEKNFSRQTVIKWCEDVLNHYLADGKFASPACMRYLARKMVGNEILNTEPDVDVYTHEIDNVLSFIKSWQQEYLDNYVPMENDKWEEVAALMGE